MKEWIGIIAATLLLFTAPAAAQSGALDCPEFENRASLGIPLVRRGLQLDRVDMVWQLRVDQDRIRSFLSIDVRERTVSPVRLYDILNGGLVPGAPEIGARLLDSTDWRRGAIDLEFCEQSGVVQGVLISYYRIPGRTGPDALRPWVTYYNHWSSRGVRVVQVSDDQGGHDVTYHDMAYTVEQATGVPVSDTVGQSLFLQAQVFAADEYEARTAPLYWPLGATLSGDQIFVENLENAVPVLNTVTSVRQKGKELLDGGVIRNLVPGSGPIEVYSGDEMRLLHVVEGRLEARLEPEDMDNRQVRGELLHDIPVSSLRAQPSPWWEANSFDVAVENREFVFNFPTVESMSLSNRVTFQTQDMVWSSQEDIPPLSRYLCATIQSSDYSNVRTGNCLDLDAEEMRLLLGRDTVLDHGITRIHECRDDLGVPHATVDSFVRHAEAVLSPQSWTRLQAYLNVGRDDTLTDGDGDGSICNHAELEDDRYIVEEIRLRAVRNVAKPLD